MLNWFVSILNSFVVVHGETTVALGHEGMLVTSHIPYVDDNSAVVVPGVAL